MLTRTSGGAVTSAAVRGGEAAERMSPRMKAGVTPSAK